MAREALDKSWKDGGVAFGGWLTTTAEGPAFAVDQAGYDFVGMDCQHGSLDEADAARMLRQMMSFRCATVVRVSENSPALIGRVLDAGADAVIVPLVSTAEEAARAVSACKYPPDGVRSFGPNRPDLPLTTAELEARALCFVMIETAEGVENAAAICATPGVDGIVIGPADLSISLGLEPFKAFTTDQIFAPLNEIRTECEKNGIILGIFSAGDVARWVERGCRFIIIGSEAPLLARALVSSLEGARSLTNLKTGHPKTPY